MNNYAREVLMYFCSRDNVEDIVKIIRPMSRGSVLEKMYQFRDRIEQELRVSDPMPGMSARDCAHAYNSVFLQEYYAGTKVPITVLWQGEDESRTDAVHNEHADVLLSAWKNKPARITPVREDRDDGAGMYNPVVNYYDFDQFDTNPHVAAYENTLFKSALNASMVPAFGTSRDDDTLLQRRVFRTESGIENGIPRHRIQVSRRYHDAEENGFRRGEHGSLLHGYDMAPTYARVQYRKKIHDYNAERLPRVFGGVEQVRYRPLRRYSDS